MSTAQITLCGKFDRDRAVKWVGQAPAGTRVIFKESKRTVAQNDRLWAMLTDLSTQIGWHGQKLSTESWKILMLDALNSEMNLVPNIAGNGFVNLGRSSSNLSKADFSNLLELIAAFGVEHGVVFHDQVQA